MTLWRYILRGFLRALMMVFSVIAFVVLIFTSVENMRRFRGSGTGIRDILDITLLEAPELLYQIFPLVLIWARTSRKILTEMKPGPTTRSIPCLKRTSRDCWRR